MADLILTRGSNSINGNISTTQSCGTNLYYQLVSGSQSLGTISIDQNTGAFTFTKNISNNSENVSGSFSYNVLCGATLGSATIIENGTICIVIESYCDICDEIQQVENKIDSLQSDFNAFETTFATEISNVNNNIDSSESNIIGAINGAVTNINGNTDTKISATEGAIISDVHNQISNVQGQLNNVENNIITNDNNNANNIHNHLSSLENNLKTEIDVNESKIDNLTVLINQTIQETDTTEEQLTALSLQLTNDTNNINSHIDQTEQDIINALTPACDICGELQNIDDTLGNVISEINANESKIDNLQSSLNAFTTQYTSDIVALNTNIDSVESNLTTSINLATNSINANVDSAEVTIIDTLTASTSSINNNIDNTETAIVTAITNASNDLKSEIDANEVKIDNLTTLVQQTITETDTVEEQLTGLVSQLTSVESNINNNIDTTETTILNALTTSTGNVISEINANEVKIDDIILKVNTILGIEDGEIPDIINLLAMLGEVKSSVTPCDVCDELASLKTELLNVKQDIADVKSEVSLLQNTVQLNQETILKSMASIECLIKKIVPYLKN